MLLFSFFCFTVDCLSQSLCSERIVGWCTILPLLIQQVNISSKHANRLLFIYFIRAILSRSDEMSDQTVYDVIVIGAGLAGISAAKTLYLNGVKNVLVLEGGQICLCADVRVNFVSNLTLSRFSAK